MSKARRGSKLIFYHRRIWDGKSEIVPLAKFAELSNYTYSGAYSRLRRGKLIAYWVGSAWFVDASQLPG